MNQSKQIRQLLEQVPDPEIPVLSVVDLGIVRDVIWTDAGPEIVITPTYSGCPAMNTIEINIRAVLEDNGFPDAKITTVLSPAWTTDWMSEAGREKLLAYGIETNKKGEKDKHALFADPPRIACPHCGSKDTEMVAQFGSTACKAMYRCLSCKEPFDYFKCH